MFLFFPNSNNFRVEPKTVDGAGGMAQKKDRMNPICHSLTNLLGFLVEFFSEWFNSTSLNKVVQEL